MGFREHDRKTFIADSCRAFTTRQIKEATGWSLSHVADELRKLIDTGRAECVRIPITRIDGCRTTSPAYRLVKRVEET